MNKKHKANKIFITVGPTVTGFSRVLYPGTAYNSSKPEYSIQLQFDPNTEEGRAAIETIKEAHAQNIEYERSLRPGETVEDYGVPLTLVNLDDTTANGVSKNPDSFTNGCLKITPKSTFEPMIFGSLTEGDGGNSDLREHLTREIPIGSTVKVKLCLMSYYQPGDEKRGAKSVAGSSIKLNAVKILHLPKKKAFERDKNVELLTVTKEGALSKSQDDDYDGGTGIE